MGLGNGTFYAWQMERQPEKGQRHNSASDLRLACWGVAGAAVSGKGMVNGEGGCGEERTLKDESSGK